MRAALQASAIQGENFTKDAATLTDSSNSSSRNKLCRFLCANRRLSSAESLSDLSFRSPSSVNRCCQTSRLKWAIASSATIRNPTSGRAPGKQRARSSNVSSKAARKRTGVGASSANLRLSEAGARGLQRLAVFFDPFATKLPACLGHGVGFHPLKSMAIYTSSFFDSGLVASQPRSHTHGCIRTMVAVARATSAFYLLHSVYSV